MDINGIDIWQPKKKKKADITNENFCADFLFFYFLFGELCTCLMSLLPWMVRNVYKAHSVTCNTYN